MGRKKWVFDYKKEYRELYMPAAAPGIVKVPLMNYIAVRGTGCPDTEGGGYTEAARLLSEIAYIIKMSKKYNHQMAGYFDYVVPPPEGLWQRGGGEETACSRKEDCRFIAMSRLPYFVTKEDLDWAIETAARKRESDFSGVEFFTYNEGLCVQCMHIGSRDNEAGTIRSMYDFAASQGYKPDTSGARLHHEIYLSNPKRVPAEKWRMVIRHPVI